MKATNLVVIAAIVVAAACTGFDFDLSRCRVDRFDAWDEISFPVKGGSGDFDYNFERLPKNWFASRGKVYAPKGEIDSTRGFGIRVSVFDRSSKSFLKKCLLFNFNNRSFKNVFDADYDFDLEDKFKVDDYIYKRERGIVTAPKPEVPKVTVTSYQFPSEQQIESIILKGDVAWIKRIIDEAINSGLKCKVVADFLSRVLTLVQSHISILRTNAEGIRQDIYALQDELSFLKSQLAELENNTIDLARLRQKLAAFRADLEIRVQQKSTFEGKIYYNEQQIDKNQAQIFSISETTIRDAQLGFDSENDKISRISQEIQGLEYQLDLLKKSRQVSINNRENYQRTLNEARARTAVLVQTNERLQAAIFELRAEFVQVENQIISIQAKIDEVQRQIDNIGLGREAEIRELRLKISSTETQITAETNEARKIELVFSALEGSLGEFQRTINGHYYSCYRVIDDSSEEQGDGTVAAAPSDSFVAYLKEVFGSVPNSNIRARFGGDIINIKHTSIFSPSWVRVYGIPFSAGYGNNMDIMETDFKCEEVDDLEVFKGHIESITRNVINVKDNAGDNYSVHLGGCTRLETATGSDIPKVGDEVYWKGRRRHQGQRDFNGYHFTCY